MGYMFTLGERIKDLRRTQDRSVRGFARDIERQPSFVVDIEAGNRLPGPETLTRIADVLGVPLSELQALDPRLPYEEREALRRAVADDWEALMLHLAGLEDWRLERLRKAAAALDAAIGEILGRRS